MANDPVLLEVERLTQKAATRHRHDRPALIAPLQAAVVELELEKGTALRPDRLDRAVTALVPAGTRYRTSPLSPITEVATLLLGPVALRRACDEYPDHIVEARFDELLQTPRILPRTRWVDELIHRYVFERHTCEKHDSIASRFLEMELAKELYFLCDEQSQARTRASVVKQEDGLVAKARAILDASPFSPPRIGALARSCHTSESTLLRAFSRELGCTPQAYVRERRLDAALLLVQSGGHSIGEIAERVGYSNLPAFTAAFHRRFGKPPSAVRGRDDALVRLPPHGMEPRRRSRTKA